MVINKIVSFVLKNATPIITLLGLALSYYKLKKTFKNDIDKLRYQKVYEKIEDLPFEIIMILQKAYECSNDNVKWKKLTNELNTFNSKVIAYGSPKAVELCAYIQQLAYNNENEPYKTLAGYALLVSQLKYDLSNQIISPELYFKNKIKDYQVTKNKVNGYVNIIVDELRLNKEFKINGSISLEK